LKNNEEILKVTKKNDRNEDRNLVWVAYEKKDANLLELLLSLDSKVL